MQWFHSCAVHCCKASVLLLVSLPIQPTGSINRTLPRCRARVFYFFSSKDFCCETWENLSPVLALALFIVSTRSILHLGCLYIKAQAQLIWNSKGRDNCFSAAWPSVTGSLRPMVCFVWIVRPFSVAKKCVSTAKMKLSANHALCEICALQLANRSAPIAVTFFS